MLQTHFYSFSFLRLLRASLKTVTKAKKLNQIKKKLSLLELNLQYCSSPPNPLIKHTEFVIYVYNIFNDSVSGMQPNTLYYRKFSNPR